MITPATAPAAQIAAATVATWQAIDTALAPIIGRRGVAALFGRSVHLAAAGHAWLLNVPVGVDEAMDLARLEQALMCQSPADASAAGRALLQTFEALLGSLIGPSLTGRLLRSARTIPSSGAPAQEVQP